MPIPIVNAAVCIFIGLLYYSYPKVSRTWYNTIKQGTITANPTEYSRREGRKAFVATVGKVWFAEINDVHTELRTETASATWCSHPPKKTFTRSACGSECKGGDKYTETGKEVTQYICFCFHYKVVSKSQNQLLIPYQRREGKFGAYLNPEEICLLTIGEGFM